MAAPLIGDKTTTVKADGFQRPHAAMQTAGGYGQYKKGL
jgi:hypothetical protein